MGDSWARQMLTGVEKFNSNVSSQFIQYLVGWNGTVANNTYIIANTTVPYNSELIISVSDLSSAAKLSLVRNTTDSYLRDGVSLDTDCTYDFSKVCKENDLINFKINVSANLNIEEYYRRT